MPTTALSTPMPAAPPDASPEASPSGAPPPRSLPVERRSIDDARALGGRLLARVAADGAVWAAASVVEEEAVVLGAAQRAARVVDLDACRAAGVRVVRRATAGTAALLAGRSLWLTLALPHVAALVPDATARSLLNRNVRPLLEGLRGLGFPAAYFGREWVSVAKRPAAVLGFDALPEGAV